MSCVRSVSYSILINGQPHGNITPSRGIRQGDPLSLYLFILYAEAISSLLHFNEREGLLSGIPIAQGDITINHLFFADDNLLFCRDNLREWGKIQEVLSCYEDVSKAELNDGCSGGGFYLALCTLSWPPSSHRTV